MIMHVGLVRPTSGKGIPKHAMACYGMPRPTPFGSTQTGQHPACHRKICSSSLMKLSATIWVCPMCSCNVVLASSLSMSYILHAPNVCLRIQKTKCVLRTHPTTHIQIYRKGCTEPVWGLIYVYINLYINIYIERETNSEDV